MFNQMQGNESCVVGAVQKTCLRLALGLHQKMFQRQDPENKILFLTEVQAA